MVIAFSQDGLSLDLMLLNWRMSSGCTRQTREKLWHLGRQHQAQERAKARAREKKNEVKEE